MNSYETLVFSVPAVIILAIGAILALRFLFRGRLGLIRIAVALLIVGCACSAAYFWNVSFAPQLLNVELTEEQQSMLSQLELPEELDKLSESQRMAVTRIKEMLNYLEEKYDIDFRYSSYTAGTFFGKEKLTAFPDGGNFMSETITVKVDDQGNFTDNYAWVQAKAFYSIEVEKMLEDYLGMDCVKVVMVSGDANITDPQDLTLEKLSGNFSSNGVIFIRGMFTKEQMEDIAEVFGSWAGDHKISGSMQLLQFNGVGTLDSITTGNYKDILTEGGVGIRVSCKVRTNGTWKVN